MSNTYSIKNILGDINYLNLNVTNIFNKVDLSDIRNDITYYNEYNISNIERWDLLSTRFYGTPKLWWMLAVFNNVKDPFNLKNLETIKIIKIEKVPTILLKIKGYL